MNLLAGTNYDPATAASKATTALLAMTALDTTNLRLSFTVPASGRVRVRLAGVLHGAATFPQILLGVLEGSTVRGRQAPILGGGNLAATTLMAAWAEFLVTGLTPGANLTWDAAYSVKTIVASTGLKYGGPNNTTANNAWGGFAFEIWDPAPVVVDANGRVDVGKVAGQTQTARDLGAQLDATVGSRLPTASYVSPPTANAIRDTIFARLISQSHSLLKLLQLIGATFFGKSSSNGNPVTQRTFRDIDDTVNATVAELDTNKNRTSITLTPPADPGP